MNIDLVVIANANTTAVMIYVRPNNKLDSRLGKSQFILSLSKGGKGELERALVCRDSVDAMLNLKHCAVAGCA